MEWAKETHGTRAETHDMLGVRSTVSLGLSGKVFHGAVLVYPVVGTFAPKGLVPLLLATCGLLLIDPKNRKDVLGGFPRSLLVLSIALALWLLVASTWAPVPPASINLWLRIAGLTIVGLVLVGMSRKLSPGERNEIERAFIVGGIVFVLLFAVELGTLGWISGKLIAIWNLLTPWPSSKPATGNLLGQASATMAIFAWPCAIAVHRRYSWRWMAVFLALVAAVLFAQSMLSSIVAFLFGLVVLAVACKAPRLGAIGTICALSVMNATLFLGAPEIVSRLRQDALTVDVPVSWQERLYILDFVTGKIAERPLIGWGFDASRTVGLEALGPFAGNPAIPLHPHNMWAQIWLELGFVGVLIAAALVAHLFMKVAALRANRLHVAAMLAGGACYLVISNISYGVWQNWWLAAAWLGIGFFAALASPADRRRSANG